MAYITSVAKAMVETLDAAGYRVELYTDAKPFCRTSAVDEAGHRWVVAGRDPVEVLTELAGRLGFEDID